MTKAEYVNLMVRMGKQDSKLDELLDGQKIQNGRLGKHDSEIATVMTELAEKKGESKGYSSSWQKIVTIASIAVAILAVIFGNRI